ncbi:hypothetical protein BBJ28_00019255, partial [Nothophytophthora sp. Chile5]
NACVCVWGRSKSKLKNKSKSHDDKDINSVPTDLEGSVSAETTPAPAPAPVLPSPEAETLLVLQNCRIRGAGSSGVLVVRGALVMALNTVEGNAHSGVTVLGGRAVLRRNKIQRNGRFGLRLLYHAAHVVVEENVVQSNACGNLDVDNSGRRFVVRWNEMEKDNVMPEDLPHSHGQLRLKTFRVVEKEVPRAPPKLPVKPVNPSECEQKRPVPATVLARPTPTPIPTATMASLPMAWAARASVNSLAHAFTLPPAGLVRSSGVPQPTAASLASHLSIAFTTPSLNFQAPRPFVASTSLGTTSQAKATPVVNRPVAAPTQSLTAPTSLQTVAGGASSGVKTPASGAPTVAALAAPVKKRRKRRPKMQQLVMGGREIVFRDTCEKPREKKVVKPRRPKEPQQPSIPPTTTLPEAGASQQQPLKPEPKLEGNADATVVTVTTTPQPTGDQKAPAPPAAISALPKSSALQPSAVKEVVEPEPPLASPEPVQQPTENEAKRGQKRKLDMSSTVTDVSK